jgi:hypothetical protein
VQYFSPYISADLRKMSVSFNTSLGSMENELMKLILDGSIQVRRGEDRISTQIECFAPEPEF